LDERSGDSAARSFVVARLANTVLRGEVPTTRLLASFQM